MNIVTGALGYSGRHITARLLESGQQVRSITSHYQRPNPFGDRLELVPLDFEDRAGLLKSMEGARVLYNTYWYRFERSGRRFEQAVERSRLLFEIAAEAGVERVVHTSITNPSLDSPLPYFSGKARVEEALKESGLSYAILRPAVFFGGQDVLLNNIAWLLRRLPLFGVAGDGAYGIQPIHVEEFAALAVEQGALRENIQIDAVGPDRLSFLELVELIRDLLKSRARILKLSPWLIFLAAKLMGPLLGDVLLTRDEISGLSQGLLVSSEPARGQIKLSEWLREHIEELGQDYASELKRHFR